MVSVNIGADSARNARTIPLSYTLPAILRDPLTAVEEISRRSAGEVVRVNMGGFRPYLITRPDHVQHVLESNAQNYKREGWLWKPLGRLIGDVPYADPLWGLKRETFQKLVSGPNIASFADTMANAINRAVDDLEMRAADGRPVDALDEMGRIIYRAITQIFIGDKLTIEQVDELGRALGTANATLRTRLALPFVPFWVPLPGDRTFSRALEEVNRIVFPVAEKAYRDGPTGDDIMSRLLRAGQERDGGKSIGPRQLRDSVVAIFQGGTETTVIALTFLWLLLDANPHVAAKLYDEIDRVVGTGRPRAAHLSELRYTKMMALELLRLYPPGWILPRNVVADDVIDGVRIERGSVIAVSPYLTNRLEEVWEDALAFDPERFAPECSRPAHRYAYSTFGGGPHGCVGKYFFTVETQLIVSSVLSKFRPKICGSPSLRPRLGLTLKPRERVKIVLAPRG